MSKQITLVQDVISKYTHSVLVHDEKSVAAFGATKGAQRWAGWAGDNVKTLDEAVGSLAANFAPTPVGAINAKTVLEIKQVLDASTFDEFLLSIDEEVLRPDDIEGKSAESHLISGRVSGRRGAATRSVLDQPLHTFSPDQRQAVVAFKANRYWTEQKQTALAIEVKRVRAVFDRNIGPGGGWRCPDGTMYGGRITDRFGRGCGGSLTRRIGRAIMRAGNQAAQTATPEPTRRLQRAARRGARQAVRRRNRDARRARRDERNRREREFARDTINELVEDLVGDYLPADGEREASGGLRRPRDIVDAVAKRRRAERDAEKARENQEAARRRTRGRPRPETESEEDFEARRQRRREVEQEIREVERQIEENSRSYEENPRIDGNLRGQELQRRLNELILERAQLGRPRQRRDRDGDRGPSSRQTPSQGGRSRRRGAEPRPVQRENRAGRRREVMDGDTDTMRNIGDRTLLNEIESHERILDNPDSVDADELARTEERYPNLLREAVNRELLDPDTGEVTDKGREAKDRPRRARVGDTPEQQPGMRERARRAIRRTVERLIGDYIPAADGEPARGGRRQVGRDRQDVIDEIVDRVSDTAEEMLRDSTGRAREGRREDNRRQRRNEPRSETAQELAERVERQIRESLGLPEKDPDAAPGDANEDRDIVEAAQTIARDIDDPEALFTPLGDQGFLRDGPDAAPADRPEPGEGVRRRRRQPAGVRPRTGRGAREGGDRAAIDIVPEETPRIMGRDVFRDMGDEDWGDVSENELRQLETFLDDLDMATLPRSRRDRAIDNLNAVRAERQRREGLRDGEKPVVKPVMNKKDRDRVLREWGEMGLPRRAVWRTGDMPEVMRNDLDRRYAAYYDGDQLNERGEALNREVRQFADTQAEKLRSESKRRVRPKKERTREEYEAERRRADEIDIGRSIYPSELRDLSGEALTSLYGRLRKDNEDGRQRGNLRRVSEELDRRQAQRDTVDLVTPPELIEAGREKVEADDAESTDFGIALSRFFDRYGNEFEGDRVREGSLRYWTDRFNEVRDDPDELRRDLGTFTDTDLYNPGQTPNVPMENFYTNFLVPLWRRRLQEIDGTPSSVGIDDVDDPDRAFIPDDPVDAEKFAYIQSLIDEGDLDRIAALTRDDDMNGADAVAVSVVGRFLAANKDRFTRAILDNDFEDARHALMNMVKIRRMIGDTDPSDDKETQRRRRALGFLTTMNRPDDISLQAFNAMVDSDSPREIERWLPEFLDWKQRTVMAISQLDFEYSPNNIRELFPEYPEFGQRNVSDPIIVDNLFKDLIGITIDEWQQARDIVRNSRDAGSRNMTDLRSRLTEYREAQGQLLNARELMLTLQDFVSQMHVLASAKRRIFDPEMSDKLDTQILAIRREFNYLLHTHFPGARSPLGDVELDDVDNPPTLDEIAMAVVDLEEAGRRIEERIRRGVRRPEFIAETEEELTRLTRMERPGSMRDIDDNASRLARFFERALSREISRAPDADDDGNDTWGGLARLRNENIEALREHLAQQIVQGVDYEDPFGVPNPRANPPDEINYFPTPSGEAVSIPVATAEQRRKFGERLAAAWAKRRSRVGRSLREQGIGLPWRGEWEDKIADDMQIFRDAVNAQDDVEADAARRRILAAIEEAFTIRYVTPDGFTYETRARVSGDRYGSSLEFTILGDVVVTDPEGSSMDVGQFHREVDLDNSTISMESFKIEMVALTEDGEGRWYRGDKAVRYQLTEPGTGRVQYLDVWGTWAATNEQQDEINEILDSVGGDTDQLVGRVWELSDGTRVLYGSDWQIRGWTAIVPDDATMARGGGFGTAFNYQVWNYMKAAGVDTADVTAGYDDGPYIWGRFGYRKNANDSNVQNMWDNIERELRQFERGEASIIETVEQAQLIRELYLEAKDPLTDPDDQPQWTELINALELGMADSKYEDRRGAVRGWVQRNASFNRGRFDLDSRILLGGEDLTDAGPNGEPKTAESVKQAVKQRGFRMNDGTYAAPLVGGMTNPATTGANNASVPVAISNPDIQNIEQAVAHIRGGGDLSEVPNELWGETLRQTSSGLHLDANTRFYSERVEQGMRGRVRIYRVRDANGRPTNQGYVLKTSTPSLIQMGENTRGVVYQWDNVLTEVLGNNLAVQLGVIPIGAGWDGTDDDGNGIAVLPFGGLIAPEGASIETFDFNYDRQAWNGVPNLGVNARLQNQMFNWLLALVDRGPTNAIAYQIRRPRPDPTPDNPNPARPEPELAVVPIDFGRLYTPWFAENAGLDPEVDDFLYANSDMRESSSLNWYMTMTPSGTMQDSRIPDDIQAIYEAKSEISLEEAERFRAEVLSTVDAMIERAQQLRQMTADEFRAMIYGNPSDRLVTPRPPITFDDEDEFMEYIDALRRGINLRIDRLDEARAQINDWFDKGQPIRPEE